MEYEIRTERYAGPYTKLLELLEERKLSITELSLGQIAQDYTDYVKGLPEKNLHDMTQFVVVAATLMLIKVKSLLPGISYTEDEEKQVHDLEEKLTFLAYLREKETALSTLWENALLHFGKRQLKEQIIFTPSKKCEVASLHAVAVLMLVLIKKEEHIKDISVKQTVSIEHIISSMLERVTKEISLTEFARGVKTNGETASLIVSFLALLELLRLGRLDARQDDDGAIIMSPLSVSSVVHS